MTRGAGRESGRRAAQAGVRRPRLPAGAAPDSGAKPRRPADAVANDFFRTRRFIGSGDRKAVADRAWLVLRLARLAFIETRIPLRMAETPGQTFLPFEIHLPESI